MARRGIGTRIYRRLPFFRELGLIRDALGAIRDDVRAIRADTRRIAGAELVGLLQFTVANDPRYGDPKRLLRYGHQTFSQNLEDGMIAEIFRRIGVADRSFVEIGVGYGLENNTAALLAEGWRGWWVEGDALAVSHIRSTFARKISERALVLTQAAVTAENIASVLSEAAVPREFDLLSLDIDRNTYWVWAAMKDHSPRVAVVEYNSALPPAVEWKVEYDPRLLWNQSSYFGASLKSMELLGRRLGYALVGCDFMGVNAFFVREDLAGDKFATPFTAENHYEPPRFSLIHRQGHRPGFTDLP